MGYVVKMPKLGMDMDQGTVVEWRVGEGDEVTDDQVVAEIESEKTTGEIRVRQDGVLHRVLVAEGESTEPGGAVAVVGDPDEDVSALVAEAMGGEVADADGPTGDGETGSDGAAGATADAAGTAGGGSSAERTEGTAAAGSDAAGDAGNGETGDGAASQTVRASPRAKKRAEELGVDLTGVEGTGPQGAISADDVEAAADADEATDADEAGAEESGDEVAEATTDAAEADAASGERHVFAPPRVRRLARELGVDIAAIERTDGEGQITEADVRAFAESGHAGGPGAPTDAAAAQEAPSDDTAAPGTRDEDRPFTGMRKTIASRLGESYREAVHVTVHRTADAETLLSAASAADEGLAPKVSVTDVLLLCLSAALDEHPAFNATFEDDVHRLRAEQNVCVAVDVDEGLVAPVVRDVGSLSLSELAERRREVTQRALSGEFSMEDLSGGTFTVSNLGVLGVESFDPVINPPQVAILGVDSIEDAVVPAGDGDGVAVRKRIGFDLSFDHRVVDGADAARFLDSLVGHVEDPWPLVVAAGGR